MTNTSDFRRYSYQTDPKTLISAFDYTRGSHAPKVRPEVDAPSRNLKVKKSKGIKSRAQLLHEQRRSAKKAFRIALLAVVCLGMIALVLNSLAVKNQLTHEIARQETEIANAKSEYISLESELNALVSVSMIDKYAVDKLGMSKVRNGQIQYMDVEEYRAQAAKNTGTNQPSAAMMAMAAATAPAPAQTQEATEEDTDAEDDEAAETEEEDTDAEEDEEAYGEEDGEDYENADSDEEIEDINH